MPASSRKNPHLYQEIVFIYISRDQQTAAIRPLIASGELSRTIRYQITDGGAGVEIGTNRTFSEGRNVGAEVHQFGTTDGRIPARPFLGLSTKDKTTALDILTKLMDNAARP